MLCGNYPAMNRWDWDRFDEVWGYDEDCLTDEYGNPIDEDGNPIEDIDPREAAREMAIQDRIDRDLGK